MNNHIKIAIFALFLIPEVPKADIIQPDEPFVPGEKLSNVQQLDGEQFLEFARGYDLVFWSPRRPVTRIALEPDTMLAKVRRKDIVFPT